MALYYLSIRKIVKVNELLILFFLSGRTQRIGQRGIAEIQKHRFFVNDQWDWNSIRDGNYNA